MALFFKKKIFKNYIDCVCVFVPQRNIRVKPLGVSSLLPCGSQRSNSWCWAGGNYLYLPAPWPPLWHPNHTALNSSHTSQACSWPLGLCDVPLSHLFGLLLSHASLLPLNITLEQRSWPSDWRQPCQSTSQPLCSRNGLVFSTVDRKVSIPPFRGLMSSVTRTRHFHATGKHLWMVGNGGHGCVPIEYHQRILMSFLSFHMP